MINNQVNGGGFRCSQCDEIKTKMWGTICNQCRTENERHEEMIQEMRSIGVENALKDTRIEGKGIPISELCKIMKRAFSKDELDVISKLIS